MNLPAEGITKRTWGEDGAPGGYYCTYCCVPLDSVQEHVASNSHKAKKSANGMRAYQALQSSYRVQAQQPWMIRKPDDSLHCGLCNREVTEGHLSCDAHKNRRQMWEQGGYQTLEQWNAYTPPAAQACLPAPGGMYYPPPQVEPWMRRTVRNTLECGLCKKEVTDGHLSSDQHSKRLAQWNIGGYKTLEQWDGYSAAASFTALEDVGGVRQSAQASSPSQQVSSQAPTRPMPENESPMWLVWDFNQGWWYCKLCHKLATDEHLVSDRHTSRRMCPQTYLGEDRPVAPAPMPLQTEVTMQPAIGGFQATLEDVPPPPPRKKPEPSAVAEDVPPPPPPKKPLPPAVAEDVPPPLPAARPAVEEAVDAQQPPQSTSAGPSQGLRRRWRHGTCRADGDLIKFRADGDQIKNSQGEVVAVANIPKGEAGRTLYCF